MTPWNYCLKENFSSKFHFMPKLFLMYPFRTMSQKNRRLLTALSYGLFSFLIAYCCISAVAGKAGILAYQDLVSQQKQIQRAIDYLQVQNQAKMNTIDNLKKDSRLAAEWAATLGYVRQGEMLIVLPEEWKNANTKVDEVRLPVLMGDSTGLPDHVIRLMAAITGLLASVAILIFQTEPHAKPIDQVQFEKQPELH